MAQKTKLNRRVVAVLVVVGVAVLALVVIGGIATLLPKDPVAYADKAEAAHSRGELALAVRYMREAVKYAQNARGSDTVKAGGYSYRLAQLMWDTLAEPGMTDTVRQETVQGIVSALRAATRYDPKAVEPHRMLCDLYWRRAIANRTWGDYVVEADRLLAVEPNDDLTYFNRAAAKVRLFEVLGDEQNARGAEEDYGQAIRLKPDEPRYWQHMILFLIQRRKVDQAEKAFGDSIELNPNSAELRAPYADYLQNNNRNREANDQIQEAIQREPNNIIGYLARARYRQNLKDFPEPLAALEEARQVNDSDYRVYGEMAWIYGRQGENDKARECFHRGLAAVDGRLADPNLRPEDRPRLDEASWRLNYFLGSLILEKMDERKKKDDPEKYQKDIQEAKECLDHMSRLGPENPFRAKIQGLLAYAQGDYAEAVVQLETVMKNFEAIADLATPNTLITAYFRQGRPGKADEVLEKLLHMPGQRGNPQVLLASARIKVLTRQYGDAQKAAADALRVDPKNPEALALQCVCQILLDRRTSLEPGIRLAPEYVSLLVDHAVQTFSAESSGSSIKLLEQLRQVDPKNTEILARLAEMYNVSGQPDRAKAMVSEVKTGDPNLASQIDYYTQVSEEKDPNKKLDMMLARVDTQDIEPVRKALAKLNICQALGRDDLMPKFMEEAAKADANSPLVVERAFAYYLRKGNKEQVAEWARKAAECDADGAAGKIFGAKLALFEQRYADAVALLKEALVQIPESKQARALLGDCYLVSNDLDKAVEQYQAVLGNDPSFVPAMVGMAIVTDPQRQSKYAEHALWVEKAWQYPDGRANGYIRGEYLKVQEEKGTPGEIQHIIGVREQTLQAKPTDLDNAFRLAVLYERTQQMTKAEETYQYLYKNSADKIAAARALAGFYSRSGRVSEVIRVLGETVNAVSDKVAAYILYGEFMDMYGYEQAANAFDKAIDADLNDPRGYRAKARFLGVHQRWAEAAAAMRKYLELRPEDMGGQKTGIRFQIEAGQYADADATIERIFGKEPLDLEAITLKGLSLLRQGKLDEADRVLALALQENPRYPNALLAHAQTMLAKGDPERARADLKVVSTLTADPDILMDYVAVLQRLGDTEEAKSVLQSILTRRKDYAPAAIAMARLYLEEQNWQALGLRLAEFRQTFSLDPTFTLLEFQMWRARKESEKADKALEAAIALTPKNEQVLSACLLGWVELGKLEKAVEMWKKYGAEASPWLKCFAARALAGLNRPAEADPLFTSALNGSTAVVQTAIIIRQMAEAYGPRGAAEKVEAYVRDSHSNNWHLYMLTGMLYQEAQEFAKSVGSLNEARKYTGDGVEQNASINMLLGMCYYGMHEYDKAEKAYQDVLAFRPNDVQALNNMAYMYASDMKQPDKALAFAKKAVELMPGNLNILDTYGWTLVTIGRLEEAESVFHRVISGGGKPLAVFFYHLGFVYEKQGRFPDALKRYQQGLAAEQDAPDAAIRKLLLDAIDRMKQKNAPETQP